MKMKKRVDRNQKIYEYVNNEIRKKAQANSNVEFKNTNETLKSINFFNRFFNHCHFNNCGSGGDILCNKIN